MPPEPTKVWLVREGDPNATEGTLAIEGSSLTFEPTASDRGSVAIPIAGITRVRRHRSSPLLSLSYRESGDAVRLFLYFAKPPPLPAERPPVAFPAFFRPGPGLERSAAALTLRATSRLRKREIDAWVGALRDAGAGR